MRVWTSEEAFDLPASVAALGTFDGVHVGHQALIRRAMELAQELDAASVVYTFDRHPLSVLCPERAPRELLMLEEKLDKLERLGVDGVLVKPFTAEFAAMEPEAYLATLVEKLRTRAVVAGFNYTFGAMGRGDAALIEREAVKLGYHAEIVEAVRDGADTVSSTLIRRLLTEGETKRAERLLG